MAMYIECSMNKRSYAMNRAMCDGCDKVVLKSDIYHIKGSFFCPTCKKDQPLTQSA